MENCEKACHEASKQLVKVNFIDRIAGRNHMEKASNFCHVQCLKKHKLGNEKRGGRWGFTPVLGMTEVFSSLFALLSLFLLIWKFRNVSHKMHKTPLRRLYQIQYYTGCAAFLSSFLFHFRETAFTRNADYFSAFASILVGLIVAVNRLVLLNNPEYNNANSHISISSNASDNTSISNYETSINRRNCIGKKSVKIGIKSKQLTNREYNSAFRTFTLRLGIAYFIFHVYKMSCFEFDYPYNKIACGFMFFTTCVCNFTTFLSYRRHSHSKSIVYSLCCLLLAGGIEILDVSPVFHLFDSHAMWHLLMAISTPMYFNFVSGDIEFH